MKTQILKISYAIIFIVALLSLASALTIKSVSSNPEEISPGSNAKVTIEIENNVGEDLENIAVILDLSQVPFAPYKSSAEKIIEEINEGDTEKVSLELIALSEAKAGIYKIPVSINYNLDDAKVVKTNFIALTINAEPEIELSSEDTIIKGENNEINIQITNRGLAEIKFLGIEVGPTAGIKIIGQNKAYIGEVDSDDFDSAKFNVFIYKNSKSTINLPVNLTYKDATNKIKTETQVLKINAYSRSEAEELGLVKKDGKSFYIIFLLVIVIAFVIYRKLKKRRKRKEA